jgi:hypothetical protein
LQKEKDMRAINITTDVYAAIWAARQPGEDTENDVLARLLNACSPAARAISPAADRVGFRDSRFDMTLPEGFEIFRNYKGTEYRAKAIGGRWVRQDTGVSYPTLNQLSLATSGNTENAWRNWYFADRDGHRHLVEKLRNDITNNVRHLI